MTFDPFGDFAIRGYLRNLAGEKDETIVKTLEQVSVETGVDEAFAYLESKKPVEYRHLLEVHRILFGAVYPWAGEDRTSTSPKLTINRANVTFANPSDIRRAVDHGLHLGNDPGRMAARPGEVMGMLAYGHPFLDGNGRALMLTHAVLAERAGISINWAATDKADYLTALTLELNDPRAGHLDAYLAEFISKPVGRDQLASHLQSVRGLHSEASIEDEAAGSDIPEVRARYEEQALKYEQVFRSEPDPEWDNSPDR